MWLNGGVARSFSWLSCIRCVEILSLLVPPGMSEGELHGLGASSGQPGDGGQDPGLGKRKRKEKTVFRVLGREGREPARCLGPFVLGTLAELGRTVSAQPLSRPLAAAHRPSAITPAPTKNQLPKVGGEPGAPKAAPQTSVRTGPLFYFLPSG